LSSRAPSSESHLSYQVGSRVEIEADYVVIGTGAGGGAAAAVLARAGFRVALCEAGPWRDPQDYPSTTYGAFRDMYAEWGQLFASGDSMIPIIQGRCVGGTTTINSAIMVRTPDDVLSEWARLGLGETMTPDAIGAANDRVEEQLGVREMAGVQLQHHNQMMLDALQAREMESHPTRRSAPACEGTSQCLQGCRSGAKLSTNLNWVPEVLDLGGCLLSSAPVDRIEIARGRAVGVHGRFRNPRPWEPPVRGARFRVRARRGVLVAASATGSAPLLERSGVRLPALGSGWRAHPGAGVIGIYPDEVGMHAGTTQGASSVQLRSSAGIKLESLALPLELLAARVSGAGSVHARVLEEIPRMAFWVAAIRAEAEGTVHRGRLGPVRVRYVPTRRDLEHLRLGMVELARTHFEAGAEAVRPGIVGVPASLGPDDLHLLEAAPLANRNWTWVLSHLFGGCPMGADPRRSVVGPDLQVRGVAALHVVDASCLPTTLGVNPQQTIMAVSMVIAEHIAERAEELGVVA